MACRNILLTAALLAAVSAFQFEVGDGIGWREPTGKEFETYNEWAARNRFRIGDSIQFKYENDSVLEVSPDDYLNCEVSNPISKFEGGDTVFEFQRSGFFYFISGQAEHCKSGQRVIVRVLHPSEERDAGEAEAPAPSPADRGGEWDSGDIGPPGANSTTKVSAMSYFVTTFIGLFVMFYMFM